MGIPRILPMRKPDPRFMGVATVSLAQDVEGSGEGARLAAVEKRLASHCLCLVLAEEFKVFLPHPRVFLGKECRTV